MTPPVESVRALVLSGGGSRGAYQAGACMGLLEAGYRPDVVVGTSVGAINGALIASGAPLEDLEHIWTALGTRHLAPRRRDAWRIRHWRSWSHGHDLARLIESHLDFEAVRRSPIKFVVTAVGLCCGELVAFENEEVTAQHVLASASFPGVFPPVRIGDDEYVDGGVVQNTPLKPAIDAGATEVVAVLTDPPTHCTDHAPTGLVETLFRASDIQTHHALLREAHHAEAINELLRRRKAWRDWRRLRIDLVHPGQPLGGTLFRVEAEQTRAWLDRGRRDGLAYMERRAAADG